MKPGFLEPRKGGTPGRQPLLAGRQAPEKNYASGVPIQHPHEGGLRFLTQLLTQPTAPGPMSQLESMLLEAELGLIQNGKVEVSWSAWLSAAEAYWDMLSEADQRLVGTPRDILNRWALNGNYFLELDEKRDHLRVRKMNLPNQ